MEKKIISKIDLNEIAIEIRGLINERQKELSLTFVEDTHTYYMKDLNGNIRDNYPSVSKVLKNYYTEFPAETISLKKAKGCLTTQAELLTEWKGAADYATNMGSRVHYLLEDYLIGLYGKYKEVRRPIFECDDEQIVVSDNMVKAGNDYIKLMHERGAVLLDTEMILGDNELGYTGQPDKVWLILDKKGELGLLVTDWKSNKPKNFETHWYTKKMLKPFNEYDDTALSHYYIQLPLYVKLLLKMLENTKYKSIKYLGGIVVLLKEDATYAEYRIPTDITNKVFNLDISC